MYFIIGGDGRQYGPISEADVRKWIAEGRLSQQSHARAESEAEFRELATFPEFAVTLGIAPAGIAPPPGAVPAAGNAGGKVTIPAIGLIITSILGILLNLADLTGLTTNLLQSFFAGLAQQSDNPQLNDAVAKMQNAGHSPFVIANAVFQIIIEILIFVGGFKMLKLKSYHFAYAAAIMSVIPCITSCCVLPLGLIFGIWAMVVLSKPEVKSQFS